ncbi:MAG: hypothetical protein ABSE04_03845 [Candidatus Microgenomates bacterium]|jgi:hypothetical protein
MNKIKLATLSSLQNLSPTFATLLQQLQIINPQWVLLVSFGAGLLGVFRDLADERGVELLEFIKQYKSEFSKSVISTPEFKDAFVNVWEMQIRESSSSKRKRLRNFLLNLGRGKTIESDLHTKIYTIVEQMTDDEAKVFGIIIRNSNPESFKQMNLNPTGINELKGYPEYNLIDICNSLNAYRLITIRDNATIGSMVSIQQITPFGELFYNFVCNEGC